MKELHKRSRNPKYQERPLFQKKLAYNLHSPQFLAIHNSHWDSCINTVGDTFDVG